MSNIDTDNLMFSNNDWNYESWNYNSNVAPSDGDCNFVYNVRNDYDEKQDNYNMSCEDDDTRFYSFHNNLKIRKLMTKNYSRHIEDNEYIYDHEKTLRKIKNTDEDEDTKQFNECELCYGNNTYYIIFNKHRSILECSRCGEIPNCYFHRSPCGGSIRRERFLKQYFIAPIIVTNKCQVNMLFDKFIKIINFDKFDHDEYMIILMLLNVILHTKLNALIFKEIYYYIISFLVKDSNPFINLIDNIYI